MVLKQNLFPPIFLSHHRSTTVSFFFMTRSRYAFFFFLMIVNNSPSLRMLDGTSIFVIFAVHDIFSILRHNHISNASNFSALLSEPFYPIKKYQPSKHFKILNLRPTVNIVNDGLNIEFIVSLASMLLYTLRYILYRREFKTKTYLIN